MSTLKEVPIPANTWVDAYAGTGITVGKRLSIMNLDSRLLKVTESLVTPDPALYGYKTVAGFESMPTTEKPVGVWIWSSKPTNVLVEEYIPLGGIPSDAFLGMRALNTQNYLESNIKLGVQHEGSTLLSAVSGLTSNNTIFLTGALPVILKSRHISFTGAGVTAFIYEGSTYTGGSSVPYENPNAINPVAGLSQIIVGAAIDTQGTLIFAPDNLIGPDSVQGKGSTGQNVGQEKVLKPNTVYQLRLKSLDTQAQGIASIISWYEGTLDLPVSFV